MNVFVAIVVLTCVLLPFNNCGAYRTDKGLRISGGAICQADLLPTFKETYAPFFTEATCVSCHVPGGQAAHAPFAQTPVSEGYKVFIQRFGIDLAPDRIYNKLKAGHYGPSFTSVEETLIDFTKTWQQAVLSGSCFDYAFSSDGAPLLKNGTTPIFTSEITIIDGEEYIAIILPPANQGYHTIEWEKVMSDTTVTFQMQVQANVNSQNAPVSYVARGLKIKSSSRDINVRDFSLLLNEKTYYVTTYSKLNFDVPGDNAFHSVGDFSSGIYIKDTSNGDTPYSNDDRWSIKVKTINYID